MKYSIGLIFLVLLFITSTAQAKNTVIAPNFSADFPRANDFVVTANGKKLPVLEGVISAMSYAIVDDEIEIVVERKKPFRNVIVRPIHAGIKVQKKGNKAIFKLPKALNLSIEFDDDIKRPLFLFTSPSRENTPCKNDPKVHYFEAGKIYDVGELRMHDNETLYLEPGAIVRGWVVADGAKNISIRGSGILDQSTRRTMRVNSIRLTRCSNVQIEDVQIHDALNWTLHLRGCDNVVVENHKQTGWRANSDGIDIQASHGVVIRGCFLRNDDDCIAVKNKDAEIVNYRGDVAVNSVLIENSVFWNTRGGNALEIGFELMGKTVQNIIFRNCDVIRVEKGAVFSIHNGGTATVQNVLFENIRIEDARDELIDLYIGLSIYSEDIPEPYKRRHGFNLPDSLKDPIANDNRDQWMYLPHDERTPYTKGRGYINNIVFRNIEVNNGKAIPSLIKGWDEKHSVTNVLIQNLKINGELILDADSGNFFLENVNGLMFEK